ncbi:MAG: hypothetical protein WBE50_18370 [Methyloceanibacter sp.]
MSSDLFIVLRLWTKYRIDLIEQERWSAIVISDLAEKICRRNVHRLDRPRHEQFANLKRPGLA